MARIETLTAYKCKFTYLQRNNPLINEQREAIREGNEPEFNFSDFIEIYQQYTNKLVIGENSDRAISLGDNKVFLKEENELKKWHIVPSAGKQGKPITVMKKTGKKHDYGPDTAALYDYHVFVYEKNDGFIAIFHRQNGSGCKSVFLETANKAIHSKGLKLEMDLIVPMVDTITIYNPTKITLQYYKQNLSSDIADNVGGAKKTIIRELGLNLEEVENKKILSIIKRLQNEELDKDTAFALIKNELSDSDDYNDAEFIFKIGKRRQKKVRLSEIENIMGTHDISSLIYERCSKSHNFENELIRLADEYYREIIESEEV